MFKSIRIKMIEDELRTCYKEVSDALAFLHFDGKIEHQLYANIVAKRINDLETKLNKIKQAEPVKTVQNKLEELLDTSDNISVV